MTIETRIYNWLDKVMNPEKPQQVRENYIVDYLVLKYERILRLREIARKEAAQAVLEGRPYSQFKLAQADRLLRMITERLNERPISHNLNLTIHD